MYSISRVVPFFLVFVVVCLGLYLNPVSSLAVTGHGFVEDEAHVLDINQVSQATTKSVPYEIDIFTIPAFSGDANQLTLLAYQHISSNGIEQVIVIVIDTAHRHVAIVGSVSVQLSDEQYREAEHGFLHSLQHSSSYTDATVTALSLLAGNNQSDTLFNGLFLLASLCGFLGILAFFSRVPVVPSTAVQRETGVKALNEEE